MYKIKRTKVAKNTTVTKTYNTKTGKTRTTYTNRPMKGLTISRSAGGKNNKVRQTYTTRNNAGFINKRSHTAGRNVYKPKRIKNTSSKSSYTPRSSRRSYSRKSDDSDFLIALIFGVFIGLYKFCKWSVSLFWEMGKLSCDKIKDTDFYYFKAVGMSLFYFYIFCLLIYWIWKII